MNMLLTKIFTLIFIVLCSFPRFESMSAKNINKFTIPIFQYKDSVSMATDSIVRRIAITNHCRVSTKIHVPGQAPIYSGYDGRKNMPILDFNVTIEIGSCTKMFTATSILQLVEKNKLSLQSKLTDLLPRNNLLNELLVIKGVNYIDSVRVYHLLNHSSGLPDYFVAGDDSLEISLHGDSSLRFTPERLISMAKTNKPYFSPGAGFKYSNTNYILLGMIIEKITGMHFSQYIQRNILDPLQMTHTFFASKKSPENRMPGFYKGKKTTMPATLAGAAGEILSNLDDMQKFIEAWKRGQLFANHTTRSLVETQYFLPMMVNVVQYGLGVVNILDLSLGHAGQTFGFQFYAGCNANGSSFVLSIDDAAVSAWEPAVSFSEILH